MSSAFSTSDTECLNRETEQNVHGAAAELEQIWDKHRLNECVQFIDSNECNKVCLQFSDDLIPFSAAILDDLKRGSTSGAELCILGDTSYGSCCVDEVAAMHINADAIIHFGHACLSKVSRLPVHYVFLHFKFDAAKFIEAFHNRLPNHDEPILVFYSNGLFYQLDNIKRALSSYTKVALAELALDKPADHLAWRLPKCDLSATTCIWIGDDDQTLFNLSVTLNAKEWLHCDRHTYEMKQIVSPLATNWMRRRSFLVEKCKDAQAIGIVLSTLTADGYLDAVSRTQSLARDRGIRTYLLSVGKINPAKLANFMEIDCFVFIGCPENSVYNSREFYKPLLTAFEAELALNLAWREQYPNFYSVDFNDTLPNGKFYKAIDEQHRSSDSNRNIDDGDHYDVSLISGRVRHMKVGGSDGASTAGEINQNDGQIEKKLNHLMETNSGNTFHSRTWTGLDPNLGNQEPAKITKGRSGIAMKYSENDC